MNLRLFLLLFAVLNTLSPIYGQTTRGSYRSDTIYIDDNVVIAPGESMIIPAGTVVLFSARFNIEVQGRIIAQGSEEKPILFTIPDTTGFSNLTSARGSWGGIEFTQTSQDSDSSIFTHCVFSYAKALGDTLSKYGGVFNIRNFSKIRIQDCEFRHAFAWHSGGAIYGEHANILIKNSIFGNSSCGQAGPPYGYGGAICFRHSSPVILNCSFLNNFSTGMGGGASFENADADLNANFFQGNRSALGGALSYLRSEPIQSITNNIFVENSSIFFGEAIACIRSNPTFLHNSLVDNYKNSHGGVFYCNDSACPVIVNSILYNTATASEYEVYMWDNLSKPQFINCNIRGGKEALGGTGGEEFSGTYIGNIDQDPQLIHTEMYYCLLTENSPCIDAGTTQLSIPDYPKFDFRGFSRITGSAPDMGAFEYKSDLGFNNPDHSERLFCYPNPFSTHIKISFPNQEKEASLKIYDINGQLVLATRLMATLKDFIWDGRDINGQAVKRGIYIVKYYISGIESSTIILRGL